jgi:hypothetical protein
MAPRCVSVVCFELAKKILKSGIRRGEGLIGLGLALAVFSASVMLIACGSGSSMSSTTTTPTQPTQPAAPSYPPIPPEPITWSPSADPNVPAPPAENPANTQWLNGANDFPFTVSNPTNNATTTSPINVVASAMPTNPIFFMRVYDVNTSTPSATIADYFTFTNSINTKIFLAPGAHNLIVMAEDTKGYISAIPLSVTISAQAPTTNGQTTISNIQAMSGWQSCGGLFPSNSARAGQICAAGGGTPTSSMAQGVPSPTDPMDNNSAEFSISQSQPGCPHYCNMLYFNPVAGGNGVKHFIYDLYFYVDNANYPQALEFDMNQTYGGNRWVWGSECNFKGDNGAQVWDIWNDAPDTGWEETSVPCNTSIIQSGAWNHIIWDVQHDPNDDTHVLYNSLTINGTQYPVATSYPYQQGWTLEEIDNAFQMDLDSNGDAYNVWLDKVNLTAY